MAKVINIAGSENSAKVRNPLGVLGLMLVTLGIYGIFWYYFINREMRDLGRAHGTEGCGTSPATSVLAITLGSFIIVPPFISIYNTLKRAINAADIVGSDSKLDAGLGLVIWIFIAPVSIYILQDNLNKVWEKQ